MCIRGRCRGSSRDVIRWHVADPGNAGVRVTGVLFTASLVIQPLSPSSDRGSRAVVAVLLFFETVAFGDIRARSSEAYEPQCKLHCSPSTPSISRNGSNASPQAPWLGLSYNPFKPKSTRFWIWQWVLVRSSLSMRTYLVVAGVSETRQIRTSVAVCGLGPTRILPPTEIRLPSEHAEVVTAPAK